VTVFHPLLILVLVAAAPPPKDTEADKLRRAWGETIDPEKDCTFKLDGDKLRIKIPETTHTLTPEDGSSKAPRVRREVAGDFDVRVTVVSVTAPDPGGPGMTAGGLVVGPSIETFVGLSRYTPAGETDEATRPTALFHHYRTTGTGTASFGIPPADRPKPLHVRLVREKNLVTGYTSPDGRTWDKRDSNEVAWPDKVYVGVFTSHSTGKPVEGVFEGLQITKPEK
jgi:hypothetical protein